ncbi:1353_t:CDS:1, partial [Acaulospora colombiana]
MLLQGASGTPVSRKRKGLDSSPFGDFSPMGFDDLEALNMLEAKFTQMRSPSSKKRRRTDSPVENVEARHPAAHALEKAMASNAFVSENKSKNATLLASSSKKETLLEDEFDEYDDEFGDDDLAAIDSKYDSWFHPAQEAAPTFVSFVRPSAGPSTSALKIIQPSVAAMKAAQKLMAEVDAEEEKEAAKNSSTKSLPPKATGPRVSLPAPKPMVTQRPSSSQPMVQTVPAPNRTIPVTPIAASLPKSDVASGSRTSKPDTPMIRPASTTFSEEKSRDMIEVPLLATVDSPTPKHLGMRSRPKGSTKAKFSTPWKQGVKPAPASSVLQLHNEQTRKPEKPPVKTLPLETTPKEIPRLPHS